MWPSLVAEAAKLPGGCAKLSDDQIDRTLSPFYSDSIGQQPLYRDLASLGRRGCVGILW